MFSVSLNWICEILNKNISLDEMMNAFNLQGFEVKEVNKVGDYIEIEEDAHTNCISRVAEFEEENSQGNRWMKEDCQIITHHADGKEEIINVQ